MYITIDLYIHMKHESLLPPRWMLCCMHHSPSSELRGPSGLLNPRLLDKELILEVRGTELQRRRAKSLGPQVWLEVDGIVILKWSGVRSLFGANPIITSTSLTTSNCRDVDVMIGWKWKNTSVTAVVGKERAPDICRPRKYANIDPRLPAGLQKLSP